MSSVLQTQQWSVQLMENTIIHSQQLWASLVVLYYNTILKGQYCYCFGVLVNMCNTGDYAILRNTEILVTI